MEDLHDHRPGRPARPQLGAGGGERGDIGEQAGAEGLGVPGGATAGDRIEVQLPGVRGLGRDDPRAPAAPEPLTEPVVDGWAYLGIR